MGPVHVAGIAHRQLRPLDHPHLQMVEMVGTEAGGIDEAGVQRRVPLAELAYEGAFIPDPCAGNAAVPSRLRDGGEGDQRRPAGLAGQELQRGDGTVGESSPPLSEMDGVSVARNALSTARRRSSPAAST